MRLMSASGQRSVNIEVVKGLAESIRTIGLQHPIIVTKDGKLVSGLHRLHAVKELGKQTIQAFIITDDTVNGLVEIDENLVRCDLTALERCEFLAQKKQLYDSLHNM